MIVPFILLSCGGPPARISFDNASYTGFLYVNGCYQGASKVIYKDEDYNLGTKSTIELENFMKSVNSGESVGAVPVSSEGCAKVFKIEFNGEFEKEANPVASSNGEVRDVVQIYQYRML